MNEQGTLSKPIMDLMTADFNMYHIQTSTQSREWLRAPIAYVSFYVNPGTATFAAPLRTLTDLYRLQPGCVEVTSGHAKNPLRHDSQGWMNHGAALVIVLSGWDSEESLAAALKGEGITMATNRIEERCDLVESFPISFTVVEKTRWEQKWRRIAPPYLKDVSVGRGKDK
jgi:hypothetical protein